MKYCEEYAALISAQMDGELTAEDSARLAAHLADCPACRAYLADLQAMEQAFASLPEVEVPAGFAAAVMAKIPKSKKPKYSGFLRKQVLPMVACLAFLVLMGNLGDLMHKPAAFDSAPPTEQRTQTPADDRSNALPEQSETATPPESAASSAASGKDAGRAAEEPVSAPAPPPATISPKQETPSPVNAPAPPPTANSPKQDTPPANVMLTMAPTAYFATLTLAQADVGTAMASYTGSTAVRATEGEREQIETKYELTRAQFDALLAALSPLPEGTAVVQGDENAAHALVIVTDSRPKAN